MNAPFKSRNSPFNPDYTTDFGNGDIYRGVFLNQDFNIPGNPYYSVRAQQTQTIPFHGQDVTWYFQNWAGNNVSIQYPNQLETGVVFKTNNSEVRAQYKGHLASNSPAVIAQNNQRKIVWDETFQKYHMVYEDNGAIYYTATTGPDNAWTPEILLASDPDYQFEYPSITVDDNGIVAVVWQDNYPLSYIHLRVKDANGWQPEKTVANYAFAYNGTLRATPVVTTAVSSDFLVIWHDYVSNRLRVRAYDHATDNFGAITDIPSTNSNSMYPSVARDRFQNAHLVWEESGNIYYTQFDHNSIGGNNEYTWWIIKETVSVGTGYTDHVFPSVTTDYDARPNVMWQAYSGPALELQIILHRRRESGTRSGWGSVTGFIGNDDYYQPSIMGFPGIFPPTQKLRAVWKRGAGTNMIWIGKYNGTSWSTFYSGKTGVDPNISSNMGVSEEAKMVFRTSSGSPYLLTTSSDNLIDPPTKLLNPSTAGSPIRHRRGVLTPGKGELALELGEFEVNGAPVAMLDYPDTLIVNRHRQWSELFRTDTLTVSNVVNLSYFRALEILNRDSLTNALPAGAAIELRLEAVDAHTNQVLTTVSRQLISRNLPPDVREHKSISFRINGARDIFLRSGISLPRGVDIQQSMVEVYYETGDTSLSKPNAAAQTVDLPKSFALLPNYPNPFNPNTTISLVIPHVSPTGQARITLHVYDINGRQVRTLVNGQMEAGEHQVVWDGTDDRGVPVASGVYFYRLTTGSGFVATRKMVLLR